MTPHPGHSPAPELAARLRADFGGEALFDEYTRHLFSRDASMYSITPLGVAFPRDTDDVAAAVAAAAEHDVPIVPRGAGTSLAGQTVGPGLVLDFSRHMNRIPRLDPEAGIARVQPGVVQDQLNRAAAEHGLMFGPDTSTSNRATLGGMIGNNSAGSGSLRYGMTIDHVRDVDVVLADASTARLHSVSPEQHSQRASQPTLEGALYRELPRIVRAHRAAIDTKFPEFWRRAGGYRLDRLGEDTAFNLAKFIVGSEGTLAIASGATVDLSVKPRHTVIAVGHFTSTPSAIAATEDALACAPASVELLDRTILDLARSKIEYQSLSTLLEGDPDALLFVSFSGSDVAESRGQLQRLTELWRRHGHGYHTLHAVDARQQAALLRVRRAGLGLLMAASTGSRRPLAFVEDTAVPPEHLVDYTRRFKEVLDRNGMHAGFYGHCSVGCLHIRPFVDLTRQDEVTAMRRVAEEIKDLVAEYGGVNSSEHGDGLARSEFNPAIFGDDLYTAMRQIKATFDPTNTLNPGKIVDAPSMTENLRDPALPAARLFQTHLSFEVLGGMRDTADRCMNIGLCRKTADGTMCPSFMATREEQDSTRGRANALVKALSEPDPRTALGDERLHEVLDLCLMCKACKSECPLGVDMASLKSEALAHYHEQHGVALRSRIFAAIRTINKLGSATAPLSNLPNRFTPLRRLLERVLGITAKRPLPRYERQHLPRWFRGRSTRPRAPRGPVVFLADSFTSYTEPAIGRAAITLLDQAGYQVTLGSTGCCGRASMSKGLLTRAKREASTLVDALAASTGPIVGCEPSCLFALRDEIPSLLAEDSRATEIAGRVRQVEELLGEAVDSGALTPDERSWPAHRRILLHGHCHQKAEVGTSATVALLNRIPGVEVAELDAGCCGMAGSFGFEAEHYDISMTIGNDRLFPAIAAEPATTLITATGVSCRQQIAHGSARTAIHPIELFLAACTTNRG